MSGRDERGDRRGGRRRRRRSPRMRSIASTGRSLTRRDRLARAHELQPAGRPAPASAPRAEVDQHERLLGRDHQRVVREAVRGALVRHARAPDPAHAHERLDQVVESGGRVVLDRRGAHHELAALGSEPSEMAVVLRACVVEVRQVAPVVDDALRVRVGEPHASQRRVLERRPPIGDPPELGDVRHGVAYARITPRTSSRFSLISASESASRFRRRSGSVFEGRTLKCQSSKSIEIPSRCETRPPSAA